MCLIFFRGWFDSKLSGKFTFEDRRNGFKKEVLSVMRIWSLHPKYLDSKGLVALWRETLLAKNVLAGKTKGYKNHPQLERFQLTEKPEAVIDFYLSFVLAEAERRGYHFNRDKICWGFSQSELLVHTGQLEYEKNHLLNKLKIRDEKKYVGLYNEPQPEAHPLFKVVEGPVAVWEKF